MSSKKYAAPLRLEPAPSRFLMIYLGGMHMAGAGLPWVLSVSLWVKLALLGGVCASAWFMWRRHVLTRGRGVVRTLLWDAEGQWWLTFAAGAAQEARLLHDSYLHRLLVVLNFKLEGRRRPLAVVLLPDCLDPEDFRRLRVRLRLELRNPEG